MAEKRKGIKSLKKESSWVWWHTPLISQTIGWQRHKDLCEFEDNLVYRVRSRAAKDTQRNPVSKNQKLKIKMKEVEFKIDPCKDGKIHRESGYCMLLCSL